MKWIEKEECLSGCRAMRGTITATVSANTHLDGRVKVILRFFAPHYAVDWGPYRRSTRHDKEKMYVWISTHGKTRVILEESSAFITFPSKFSQKRVNLQRAICNYGIFM